MYIYVCTDCKKVLTTVNFINNQTYSKTLYDEAGNLNDNYTVVSVSDTAITYTCPLCNKKSILEVSLTKENFKIVTNLLKENKIKDAWEVLFDILL